MPDYSFTLNGKTVTVNTSPDHPLLWTLRDQLGVTGPKMGCNLDVCKACTCLIDGEAWTTCVTRVADVAGREVVTIEGLGTENSLHPVQEAWLEQDVPQCGFCQPGQIMNAVALLKKTREPTDDEIDRIENVCRCGTYFRIRQAIKSAAKKMAAE